jgi:hypothetical protein
MQGEPNNSAARARGILAAWERRDQAGLEVELSLMQAGTAIRDMSFEEQERMELLSGVATQVRHAGIPSGASDVCLRLLEHLAMTGEHPAIRSEKLSFFPY